jgi:hypothetical protein
METTEIASVPRGAKTTTITTCNPSQPIALKRRLRGNDQRIQKEIDIQIGEVQSVFIEIGEALGVVPAYDHALFVATKRIGGQSKL